MKFSSQTHSDSLSCCLLTGFHCDIIHVIDSSPSSGTFQEACQNYIRVLTMTTPGILLACGTNSFRPLCHYYNITGSEYHIDKSKPGQALCPYGPQHNSTSVFVGEYSSTKCFRIRFDKKIALCDSTQA